MLYFVTGNTYFVNEYLNCWIIFYWLDIIHSLKKHSLYFWTFKRFLSDLILQIILWWRVLCIRPFYNTIIYLEKISNLDFIFSKMVQFYTPLAAYESSYGYYKIYFFNVYWFDKQKQYLVFICISLITSEVIFPLVFNWISCYELSTSFAYLSVRGLLFSPLHECSLLQKCAVICDALLLPNLLPAF